MQTGHKHAMIEILKELYQSPGTDIDLTQLISRLLPLFDGAIDIFQWGNDFTSEFLTGHDLINHCYNFSQESGSIGSLTPCNVKNILPDLRKNLSNATIGVLPHNPDCFAEIANRHGENSFNMAIVNTTHLKADCIEISKHLVTDGGIILVTDLESWHPSETGDTSKRDVRKAISSFPEYYYIDRHSSVIIVNRKTSAAYKSMPAVADKYNYLRKTFDALQADDILFLILRSPDYIPVNCSIKNDIDLIIHPSYIQAASKVFLQLGYSHYRDQTTNNSHLYNSRPHDHFLISSLDIHIDVVQGLYYSSLNNDEKVPIHKKLQELIFDRRRYVQDCWKCIPHVNDLFTHIVCHAIFDKKVLSPHYSELLNRLFPYIDKQTIEDELKDVFFAFTPTLLNYFDEGCTTDLIQNYLRFSDY